MAEKKSTKKSKKPWYLTGEKGEQRGKEIEEDLKKRRMAVRFWLPAKKKAKVTFLDTKGFYFSEHNLYQRGKWGNYYTCIKDIGDNCPICDAGFHPSFVCAYTIIDHSKYYSERLKKDVANQKKLLVMKKRAYDKLNMRRDSEKLGGDLTLALFEFSRASGEECNTGEFFDFMQRLDKKKLAKLCPKDLKGDQRKTWLQPFDYMELFAPQDPAFLRRVVGASSPVGSAEEAEEQEEELGDDDVDAIL